MSDEGVRSRFLDALVPALDDPRRRVVVIMTMRADLYSYPLAYPEFGRRLGDGVVNVVPLSTDELEAAAREPMLRAGCHFESTLLVALLGDIAGQPGALPVFQYALSELFERRVGDTLTMASYVQIGGVRGALAQRAEDLYASFNSVEQRVGRQLFLRLVTIDDGDEWGRRRVRASEVLGLDVDVVALQTVIHRFGDHRLLSFDRDQTTGSPTLEVAHEALLTEWPRLRDAIADARVDVRRRASLGAAYIEWDEADRNPDYLFSGTRLDEYAEWSKTSTLALTSAEQLFLDEAIARRDADERYDAERTAREQWLDRRARVRTWALAAVIATVAGVSAWFVFFAGPGEDPPRVARVAVGTSADFFDRQMTNGWNQAQREFDLIFDEKLTPASDVTGELLELLKTKPDLVIIDSLAGDVGELTDLVSSNPDQLFAIPDEFSRAPNLVTFEYASHEGSFLAGAAAALTSRTGVIGFIGGAPSIIAPFRSGYEAGARSVDPDIEILSTYLVGDIFNVFVVGADALAVTKALIDERADVIYHAFGDAGALVLSTVADSDADAWVIGVDIDQSLHGPVEERGHVLTSMLKRHDLAIIEILRRLEAGTLTAGAITGDVSNGVMGLVTPGNTAAPIVEQVEAIRQGIIDGTIEVPEFPDRPPISALGTDYSVDVEMLGQDCAAESFAPLSGDVVRFDIVNPTDTVMRMNLFKIIDGIPIETLTLQGLFTGEHSFGGLETGGVVAAQSTNALTVRLDEPGDWILNCFSDGTDDLHPHLVQVADPEASTGRTVLVHSEKQGDRACSSDLSGLRASDVVNLTIINEGPIDAGVALREVTGITTSFEPGWVSGSGAQPIRFVLGPEGESTSAIVRLGGAGTFALSCFGFGEDTAETTIVFDVAP